jgi:hypothetical protein
MLLPPVADCVQRVATRRAHGFSDEAATRKMHGEFARAVIADRHVFADSGTGAASVADEVFARFRAGTLGYDR